MRRAGSKALGICLVAGVLGGCAGSEGGAPTPPETIEQSRMEGVRVAPLSKRIDLEVPSFSEPTEIDNPLNPLSAIKSALVLGVVDGKPLRIEITLLPDTRVIEWEGRLVETVVSQFVAYRAGRMKEVAIDYYAQADDGAVWYFGEDVFNYSGDGHISNMEGAWLAGRDGPAGMITPDRPELGDVYRSENVPGLVFEESTVQETGKTVAGPTGPVEGAFVIDEHHYPGGAEAKSFAPGYGEFFTGDRADFERMALAIPIDALGGPPPAELTEIRSAAETSLGTGSAGDWGELAGIAASSAASWDRFQDDSVPRLLAKQMNAALDGLEGAVRARDPIATQRAGIELAVAGLDLELRYRPVTAIDFDRFEVQAAELGIDAGAGELDAVRSDLANLHWIRARIVDALSEPDRQAIDTQLVKLIGMVEDRDLAATQRTAERLAQALAEARP